jgi:predicted SAM-dependent methyltransferase
MQATLTGPLSYPRTRFRSRASVHRDIDRLLNQIHHEASAGLGLHLGAGTEKIPGLVNCDLHNPAADCKIDAIHLGEFADESVDLIEHHHMWEHLSLADSELALREWSRVLKPGGFLVVTCPDLLRLCLLYIKNRALDIFTPRDKQIEYNIKMIVGSQEHPGMFHRSHYDGRLIRKILRSHGYSVEFIYPYPSRPTPSLLTIARKTARA